MLKLLVLLGFACAATSTPSRNDRYRDWTSLEGDHSSASQERLLIMSSKTRDNLMLRPINMEKMESFPTMQFGQPRKMEKGMDDLEFVRRRELRRHPMVQQVKSDAERMGHNYSSDSKDGVIADILMDMESATANEAVEKRIVEEVRKGDFTIGGEMKKGLVEVPTTTTTTTVQPEHAGPTIEFVPHFEKSSYEVMAPVGVYEKPFVVAVINFVSRRGMDPPVFTVSLDRLEWMQIGKVETKEKGDRLESSVTVELRPNTDLRLDHTKKGFYSLAVKGTQGHFEDVTKIRLEAMDFGPIKEKRRKEPATTSAPGEDNEVSREVEDSDLISVQTDSVTGVQKHWKKDLKKSEIKRASSEVSAEESTLTTEEAPQTTETTEAPEATESIAKLTEPFNKGVVEIPTPVLTIGLDGVMNGSLIVHQPVENGLPVADFRFTVLREGEDQSGEIVITIDRSDLFTLSSRRIIPGEDVTLFIADSAQLNGMEEFPMTISAELFGEKVSETVMVSVEMKTDDGNQENPKTDAQKETTTVEPTTESATSTEGAKQETSTQAESEEGDDVFSSEQSTTVAPPESTESSPSSMSSNADPEEASTKATTEKTETTSTSAASTTVDSASEVDASTETSKKSSEMDVEIVAGPTSTESQNEGDDGFKTMVLDQSSEASGLEPTTGVVAVVELEADSTEAASTSSTTDSEVEEPVQRVKEVLPNMRTVEKRPEAKLPKATPEAKNPALGDVLETTTEKEKGAGVTKKEEVVQQILPLVPVEIVTEGTTTPEGEEMEVETTVTTTTEEPSTTTATTTTTTVEPLDVSDLNLPKELISPATADRSLEISIEAAEIVDTQSTTARSTTPEDKAAEKDDSKENTSELKTIPLEEKLNVETAQGSGRTQQKFKKFVFAIPELAKTGDVVGELKDVQGYFKGGSAPFKLEDNKIIVACPMEECLDFEKTQQYKFYLMPTSGLPQHQPIQVVIDIEDVNDNAPLIELSDRSMRVSNGQLLVPFAVEIKDKDSTFDDNKITLTGSAAQFLTLSKVENQLYEIKVSSFPPRGKFELIVTVQDKTGKYPEQVETVDVHVQNTQSKAHFRRPRYERTVNADKIHKGNTVVEPELEGVAIDSVRFLAMGGNPGWLTVDDYNGHVSIADVPRNGVVSGRYKMKIVAVDRDTSAVVTECELILNVLGGQKPAPVFKQNVISATVDRDQASSDIDVKIPTSRKADVTLATGDIQGIDEDGLMTKIDKASVSLADGILRIRRSVVQKLRIVHLKIFAEQETAAVVIYLSSDPVLIALKKKEAGRPEFAVPWTKRNQDIDLSIREESPNGAIVIALPANNPLTGESVPVRMSGEHADKFALDSKTGVITVATRFDYETMSDEMKDMELLLTAGEPGYESKATVKVHIVDIDDNPPMFDKTNLKSKVTIPEDLAPGTPIATIPVHDNDAMSSEMKQFDYLIQGDGKENFEVAERNGSALLFVSPTSKLDRETSGKHELELVVSDAAGNTDTVMLTVILTDVNDNAPKFEKEQYDVQAVENWAEGVALDSIVANDVDEGVNGQVAYRLKEVNHKYFAIDSRTGELRVVRDLLGLAREETYNLTVIAEDMGTPPLSSSVPVRVKVSPPRYSTEGEQGEIRFVLPTNDYVLEVKENTPSGQRVYGTQAKVVGMGEGERMNIKYSAEPSVPGDAGYFNIDENSGEIFVSNDLDFEQKQVVSPGDENFVF